MEKKDVIITVEVDAAEICPSSDRSIEFLLEHTDISDDNLGCTPGGIRLNDFLSMVYWGKKVTWQGQVKNQMNPSSPYKIKIEQIEYKSGADLFVNKVFNYYDGSMTADVIEEVDPNNCLFIYAITVGVYHGAEQSCLFTIDPKLQANN